MEVKEENTAPKPEAASVTETQQTVTPKTKPKDPKALVGQDMTKWLLAIAVSIILLGIAYQLVGTEEPDFVITEKFQSFKTEGLKFISNPSTIRNLNSTIKVRFSG